MKFNGLTSPSNHPLSLFNHPRIRLSSTSTAGTVWRGPRRTTRPRRSCDRASTARANSGSCSPSSSGKRNTTIESATTDKTSRVPGVRRFRHGGHHQFQHQQQQQWMSRHNANIRWGRRAWDWELIVMWFLLLSDISSQFLVVRRLLYNREMDLLWFILVDLYLDSV